MNSKVSTVFVTLLLVLIAWTFFRKEKSFSKNPSLQTQSEWVNGSVYDLNADAMHIITESDSCLILNFSDALNQNGFTHVFRYQNSQIQWFLRGRFLTKTEENEPLLFDSVAIARFGHPNDSNFIDSLKNYLKNYQPESTHGSQTNGFNFSVLWYSKYLGLKQITLSHPTSITPHALAISRSIYHYEKTIEEEKFQQLLKVFGSYGFKMD